MKRSSSFDFEEYEFDLFRRVLLWWGVTLFAVCAFNTLWYFEDFVGTLIENLVLASLATAALLLRRLATPDRLRVVTLVFVVLSTLLLSWIVSLVEEQYLVNIAVGLVFHVIVSSLLFPPSRVVPLGVGVTLCYLMAIAARVLLRGENISESWSLLQLLANTVFPGIVIMASVLVMRSQIGALQHALVRVKALEGILPICSYCKNIMDEDGNWHSLDSYVSKTTEVQLSHGICPDCYPAVVAEMESTEPPGAK